MKRRLLILGVTLGIVLFVVLGVTLVRRNASPVRVTGTVTFRKDIALPAGAKVHVMLEDVSRLDAAASTVAEEVVVADGKQPSVAFALECQPHLINAKHSFTVRAEVLLNGEKRFLSTAQYPVTIRDRAARADIVVESIWHPPIAPPDSVVPGAATFLGTYQYMADAGIFSYCGVEALVPVAQQGDNAALERAYLDTPHQPGAPVLVTFYGRLEPMPPMEGRQPRDHVIVDRFLQIWPGETCDRTIIETPLEDTHWRLVELKGKAVIPREDQDEISLTFQASDHRAGGFAGCNRFTGEYKQTSWYLRIGPLAMTRMACPNMDDEQALMKALEDVQSFQILGESLDLRGDAGSVARFRADRQATPDTAP